MAVLTGVAIALAAAVATLIALHAYAQWTIRNIEREAIRERAWRADPGSRDSAP